MLDPEISCIISLGNKFPGSLSFFVIFIHQIYPDFWSLKVPYSQSAYNLFTCISLDLYLYQHLLGKENSHSK